VHCPRCMRVNPFVPAYALPLNHASLFLCYLRVLFLQITCFIRVFYFDFCVEIVACLIYIACIISKGKWFQDLKLLFLRVFCKCDSIYSLQKCLYNRHYMPRFHSISNSWKTSTTHIWKSVVGQNFIVGWANRQNMSTIYRDLWGCWSRRLCEPSKGFDTISLVGGIDISDLFFAYIADFLLFAVYEICICKCMCILSWSVLFTR
jgi:hypothetical protein